MGNYEIITKSDFTPKELAKLIDHSLLFAYTTKEEISAFCEDIKTYGFGCAAINPRFIKQVAEELKGYDVMIDAPIGYPWGTNTTEIKSQEIVDSVRNGATDADYVISVGAAAGGDWDYLKREAETLVKTAHGMGVKLKAILETCYLTDEQKVQAALIQKEAGVDYVKTSTGFGSGWCNVHDVELLKKTVGTDMGVKASGKVDNFAFALDLLHAGASRIGTRAGKEVIEDMLKHS